MRPRITYQFIVSIPAADDDQLRRIAERVSKFASCDIQRCMIVTDDDERGREIGRVLVTSETVESQARQAATNDGMD
jgi:hypothetical protein